MFPYFFLLAIAATGALTERSEYTARRKNRAYLALYYILLTIFAGFRYEVGSDWAGYLRMLDYASYSTLIDSFSRAEPAYMAINWFSANQGLGIVFVNLVCAILSCAALYKYCKSQSRPWLATYIVVAFFYIVVVIGVTRQGTAGAIVFLGLTQLFQGKVYKYIACVLLASTFHISAIVMLPLFIVAHTYGRVINFLIFAVAISLVGGYIYSQRYDHLEANYISKNLESSGVYFRFIFHITASIIFLHFRRRMQIGAIELKLYSLMSYSVFACFLLLFISPSTTAIDRIAFYLFPLQVATASHLPNVIYKKLNFSGFTLFSVLALYAAQLFIWMSFGTTSDRFTPYQFGWFGQ